MQLSVELQGRTKFVALQFPTINQPHASTPRPPSLIINNININIIILTILIILNILIIPILVAMAHPPLSTVVTPIVAIIHNFIAADSSSVYFLTT